MIARIVLAIVLFILAAPAANAHLPTCTLSATGVAFGEFTGTKLTSVGEIVVTCRGHTHGDIGYNIQLNTGVSGTYNPREMRKNGNDLSYNLYTDPGHFFIWGNGSFGTTFVSGRIDLTFQDFITFSVPVYGRVPNQSEPTPGNYSDTIEATMFYGGIATETWFNNTARISPSCAITADDLRFGNYTGDQLDDRSAITVTCTNSTHWDVALNAGTYQGATVTTRRMTGPTRNASLAYDLYRDSGRFLNWGQTIGFDTKSGTGTGFPQTLKVYGRIPRSNNPVGGGYEDMITATITF